MCSKEGCRIVLWMCWVVNMVRMYWLARRLAHAAATSRPLPFLRPAAHARRPTLSPKNENKPPKKHVKKRKLVTSLYYALSFATSSNLLRSYRQLDIPLSNEIWRAPIAAAVLGGLLALFFNLVSCAVLAKKTVDRRGGGFGFGFVAAMCASLAFFSLLCGLVLDGFKDVVRSELQVKRKECFLFVSVF